MLNLLLFFRRAFSSQLDKKLILWKKIYIYWPYPDTLIWLIYPWNHLIWYNHILRMSTSEYFYMNRFIGDRKAILILSKKCNFYEQGGSYLIVVPTSIVKFFSNIFCDVVFYIEKSNVKKTKIMFYVLCFNQLWQLKKVFF